MHRILRVLAIICAIGFSMRVYVQAQLTTCRYFAGCSADAISTTCKLVLDRVSCTDSILAFTPQCIPDSCKTDCQCSCNNSVVNAGFHGIIDFYDQCREVSGQQIYECNNCGNPYPFGTPPPTPTPTPPP